MLRFNLEFSWFLLGYLLSHRVRQELFLPLFNEFLEDYLFTKKRIRRKKDQRILAVVYTWRTIAMLGQCILHGLKTIRAQEKRRGIHRLWDAIMRRFEK